MLIRVENQFRINFSTIYLRFVSLSRRIEPFVPYVFRFNENVCDAAAVSTTPAQFRFDYFVCVCMFLSLSLCRLGKKSQKI